MFWIGLLIPLAYVPNVTGRDILTGWEVLSLALPFFFVRRVELGVGHYLGLAFLAYATLALAWTEQPIQGVWDLWLLYILAGCFMLGASHDPRSLYLGAAIGVGVSTLLAIPQAFGWTAIFALSRAHPTGLFVNPDMFGESAALVSVALIATRQWWPLILTLPPVVFTGCRSAQLACFVCAVLWLWQHYRKLSIPALAIAFIGGLAWHHGWDGSEDLRLAMWKDTWGGLTLFGHGPGSFFALYPKFAVHTDTMFTRPESAHNDFLELVFEFGVGAIPIFTILVWGIVQSKAERYILVAFAVVALVSFPRAIPTEGLLGMVALGSVLRGRRLALSEWLHRRPTPYLRQCEAGGKVVPMESVYAYCAGV